MFEFENLQQEVGKDIETSAEIHEPFEGTNKRFRKRKDGF